METEIEELFCIAVWVQVSMLASVLVATVVTEPDIEASGSNPVAWCFVN
jgi:hypothetical protein